MEPDETAPAYDQVEFILPILQAVQVLLASHEVRHDLTNLDEGSPPYLTLEQHQREGPQVELSWS